MSTDRDSEHERPRIDVSKSIGEGGHEVEDLGYQEVPDSVPLTPPERVDHDLEAEIDRVTGEAARD